MDQELQFPETQRTPDPRLASMQQGLIRPMVSGDMPEEWGGRPKGTSRRAIRMQDEWDKQRARQLQEMQAIRSLEAMDFEQNLKLRNQQIQEEQMGWKREVEWSRQNVEHRTNQHVMGFLQGMKGGYDEMGNTIPELDPESPNYEVRRKNLLRDYPLAAKHPEIQPILGAMDEIFQTRKAAEEDRIKESQQEQKANEAFRVQQEATAAELGIDTDQFINPETGQTDRIALSRAIGEARAERGETREAKAEEKAQTKEVQSEIKLLNREIRDLTDTLEAEKSIFDTSKGRTREAAAAKIQATETKIKRREDEIQALRAANQPQRPEILKEAVDAARQAIRDNPDSPQAQAARQIIEAYEASQPEQPTGEEGGGETISEPIPQQRTRTEPQSSLLFGIGQTDPEQQPFLSQQEQQSIPQTRREFATGEMAENLDTMEEMNTELDRLYKVRFTSKDNMEKYKSLQKELSKKRKEDSKLRAARQKEIREEMKKLGPYSSGESRKKYIALDRELRLISGV
jgi:hypothetical protein